MIRQLFKTGKTVRTSSFRYFSNAAVDTRPQFLVGEENGFLPRKDPLAVLPKEFADVEKLLQDMPITKKDGTPGLLSKGLFGEATKAIPDHTDKIKNIEDSAVLYALFRDYTFWASSYLLEPCNLSAIKTNDEFYGLGRDVLPLNISSPLLLLAEKLKAKPFMEYAMSYSLYNWKKKDPNGPMHFDNLEVIRSFSGHRSEAGFILVHATMVSNTPNLVKATLQTLDGARNHDRDAFNTGLSNYQKTMRAINVEMETMWSRSLPEDYAKFRVLIMGIKNQPMFPNGVFYENRDPATGEIQRLGPFQFRGESGANDNIIPTGDNLLQLTDRMPSNPLTEILQDFRTYRPIQHNTWLTYVKDYAALVKLRDYAESDHKSLLLYLSILDEIRDFRNRHWNFTKEYIIKRTTHPVATGGSPIVEWLPNQLGAILTFMEQSIEKIDVTKLPDEESKELYTRIKNKINAQSSHLQREVSKLKEERDNKPKH